MSVRIPEGSILRPRRPAPRAARGLTGFRALDAVLGALAQAVPDRVRGRGEGGATMIAIGGTHADGEAFVFVDFMCGGWGARPDRDGIDGISALAANLANVPVEEIELDQPVRVRRYGFLPDTGGPGRWRGCLSVVREFEFLGGARAAASALGPPSTPALRAGRRWSGNAVVQRARSRRGRPAAAHQHDLRHPTGRGVPPHDRRGRWARRPGRARTRRVLADVLDERITPGTRCASTAFVVDLARGTTERVR